MTAITRIVLVGAIALGVAITTVAQAPVASAQATTTRTSVALASGWDPGDPLTADEIAGLTFMREEEKLARDVYLALSETWNIQIFSNISRSEQSHMRAVGVLLDRYGLADPTAGNESGEFTNPELQALYDELIDVGRQSLVDALTVGAIIEETDIADLDEALASATHSDVQQTYQQLKNGSMNHLRAFVSTLQRRAGESYQAQILDPVTFSAIVVDAQGRTRGRGARF